MRIIYVFVFILLIESSCDFKKYEIQYDLKTGTTYNLEITAEQNLVQKESGKDQVIHTKLISGMAYHVLDIDDNNNYLMEVYFTLLYYDMKSPFLNMTMDSRKLGEKEDIYSMVLRELINKPFRIRMNLKGEINGVDGLNEYFQRITARFEGLGPQQRLQIRQILKKAYGEEAFQSNMEMMTSMFPDHLVRRGSKWTNNLMLRKGVSVELHNTYRLTDIKDNMYYISDKAYADSPSGSSQGNEQMRYDIHGEQNGNYKINVNTGWIVEANLNQSFEGKVIVSPGENAPKGMEWPVSIESSLQMKGSEVR